MKKCEKESKWNKFIEKTNDDEFACAICDITEKHYGRVLTHVQVMHSELEDPVEVANAGEELGMISHKKSLITIFGHSHFRQKYHQKFDIFYEKISKASDFGSYLV